MVTFTNTKEQLTSQQIEETENIIGLKFPSDYKSHLRKYNGGQCIPNVFTVKMKGKLNKSNVNCFFAIYDGEYDNFKEYFEICKIEEKRMPVNIIPIADDPGGNLICISCDGKDKGFVYFWDHENEVDYTIVGDDDYSNLYLIAKSFTEFIGSLTDY